MSTALAHTPAAPRSAGSTAAERPGRLRWVRWGTDAVTAVAIAVALAVAVLMLVPAALGYDRFVLTSSSMAPGLPAGTLLYSKAVPVEDLAVGDVITFWPPAEYHFSAPVTHRIVEIDPTPEGVDPAAGPQYRTQGDANARPDPWRMHLESDHQGVVTYDIPYVGYVFVGLRNPTVRVLIVGVPALLLGMVVLAGLWSAAGEGVLEQRRRAAGGDA